MPQDDAQQTGLEELRQQNAALRTRLEELERRVAMYEAAESRVRRALRAGGIAAVETRDVMTPHPQVARLGDSLRSILQRFEAGGFRRLPVLDAGDNLVGIVTDHDVRLALNSPLTLRERWQDEVLLDQVTVDVCMTPDPITVGLDTPLHEVARVMRTRKIGGLPVLDGDGRLVGIVTETDLLRTFENLLAEATRQV